MIISTTAKSVEHAYFLAHVEALNYPNRIIHVDKTIMIATLRAVSKGKV